MVDFDSSLLPPFHARPTIEPQSNTLGGSPYVCPGLLGHFIVDLEAYSLAVQGRVVEQAGPRPSRFVVHTSRNNSSAAEGYRNAARVPPTLVG